MCRLLLAVTLLDGPRNLFYFTTTGPALGGRFTAWQMYRHPVSLHAGQKSTPTLSHRAQRLGGIQRFVRISKQFTGVTPSARHSPIHSIFIHNYLSSSYAPQCQGTMLNETDKVPALREFTVHPGRQTRTKLRRSQLLRKAVEECRPVRWDIRGLRGWSSEGHPPGTWELKGKGSRSCLHVILTSHT